MPARNKDTLDQVYSLIANEEDARVCTDIPDEACREVPVSYTHLTLPTICSV